MEQWKPIIGFEGLYEVSSTGKVKSLNRVVLTKLGKQKVVSEKILTLHKGKPTLRHPIVRYHVELWKDNSRSVPSIHRLVALHFIPNPLGKPQVNHIDGNPANNNFENLEWATNAENVRHAYLNGLIVPRTKPIKGTNLITGEILLFRSFYDAAKHFNVTPHAIAAPLKGHGRAKYGCGYKWEYQ